LCLPLVEITNALGPNALAIFCDDEAFIQEMMPHKTIRIAIIGTALIAMALSLDDFIITFFTIGGGNTLPTFLWGMMRKLMTPQINVVAVCIMALTITVSLIALRISRYRG
jgi:ABC-type spermidine/putrescine transport system permease subunit II